MGKFGEEMIESAREALDIALGRVEAARAGTTTAGDAERAPFDPASEPDRFTWNTGAGLTVTGEGEGDPLFTWEDVGLTPPET